MKDLYENPLNSRYASREMSAVFSDDNRFKLWRRLWIALAESEKELGLGITDEQIAEMKRYADDINYDVAEKRESEVVMTLWRTFMPLERRQKALCRLYISAQQAATLPIMRKL